MDELNQAAWWQESGGFFSDLYMEADNSRHTFFRGEKDLSARTAEEVSGVERLCELTPGDVVVDCPCGYGRHSLELARRGYQVTGVDLNTRYLGVARDTAFRENVSLQFVQGDMRSLPKVQPAKALINMFYSFGFFTDAEDEQVLKGFYEALQPGGLFLMHTIVTVEAYEIGHIPSEERRLLQSGGTLISKRFLDPDSRREIGDWSVVDADGVERAMPRYDVRIYGTDEFSSKCRAAGFSDVQAYGDWMGRPFAGGRDDLIVVARKPA